MFVHVVSGVFMCVCMFSTRGFICVYAYACAFDCGSGGIPVLGKNLHQLLECSGYFAGKSHLSKHRVDAELGPGAQGRGVGQRAPEPGLHRE